MKTTPWFAAIIFSLSRVCVADNEQDFLNLARSDLPQYVKLMAASLQSQVGVQGANGTILGAYAFDKSLGLMTELPEGLVPRTQDQQTNYVCSANFLKAIVLNGGTYAVQYVNRQRQVIGYVEVGPGACDKNVEDKLSFAPPGCEYRVTFPDAPTITDYAVPDYKHLSAQLTIGNQALKASCSIFDSPVFFGMSDGPLEAWVRDWASKSGLSDLQISIRDSNMGKVAEAKGVKKVAGAWATYKTVIFHGQQSRMALVVASPSIEYPSPEMDRFLKSIVKE